MSQVVLPVLNEAEALPWVLDRMPADLDPIVVDNGSTDGSPSTRSKSPRATGRAISGSIRGSSEPSQSMKQTTSALAAFSPA